MYVYTPTYASYPGGMYASGGYYGGMYASGGMHKSGMGYGMGYVKGMGQWKGAKGKGFAKGKGQIKKIPILPVTFSPYPTPSFPTPFPTTARPTQAPVPTFSPTSRPTRSPTPAPTRFPTRTPTFWPTGSPTTARPTTTPTLPPTQQPTFTMAPTFCIPPDEIHAYYNKPLPKKKVYYHGKSMKKGKKSKGKKSKGKKSKNYWYALDDDAGWRGVRKLRRAGTKAEDQEKRDLQETVANSGANGDPMNNYYNNGYDYSGANYGNYGYGYGYDPDGTNSYGGYGYGYGYNPDGTTNYYPGYTNDGTNAYYPSYSDNYASNTGHGNSNPNAYGNSAYYYVDVPVCPEPTPGPTYSSAPSVYIPPKPTYKGYKGTKGKGKGKGKGKVKGAQKWHKGKYWSKGKKNKSKDKKWGGKMNSKWGGKMKAKSTKGKDKWGKMGGGKGKSKKGGSVAGWKNKFHKQHGKHEQIVGEDYYYYEPGADYGQGTGGTGEYYYYEYVHAANGGRQHQ